MARIRTIKPEAFTSESLAEVAISAERTLFGLLTQADDHGRVLFSQYTQRARLEYHPELSGTSFEVSFGLLVVAQLIEVGTVSQRRAEERTSEAQGRSVVAVLVGDDGLVECRSPLGFG